MGSSSKYCRNERISKKQNNQKIKLNFIAIVAMFCLSSFQVASGARILFYIGLSSHSHRVSMQPLATKLAEFGHDVTFLSPIKPEVLNPKIKEYCPPVLAEINKQFDNDMGGESVIARANDKYFEPIFSYFGQVFWGMLHTILTTTLQDPVFQEWIKTNASFDLVITEHPYNKIVFGLAHLFGAKVIGFGTTPFFVMESDMFGLPSEASWLPEMALPSRYKFIPDQFHYEFNKIAWYSYYRYGYLPRIDSLLKEVFPEKLLPLTEELIKNMNLYFLNNHFSYEFPRSLPPFIVPIGGMHVQVASHPLPKKIADFIKKEGNEGFVYISFGSIFKISALPPVIQSNFFAAIASFTNVRFLLKWEGEFPKNVHTNVLPMQWFPQQDVLAHPKCRGFVTQGGLVILQQAASNGVPVIVVPIFGDQPFNAEVAVHQGNGITLELADISQETFSHAIRQLLYNKQYSVKAKEVASKFRDRIMSPVDTAVWWTEYVLRHNDTSHLKPLGINQEWWERRLLDFWACVFALITLIIFAIVWTLQRLLIICKLCNSKAQDKVKRS